MDFSGIIKQIGDNLITEFKPGDEVYGQASIRTGGTGTFAEMAVTNVDSIALKPTSLNYNQAAALPLVGVSASSACRNHDANKWSKNSNSW